MADSVARVRILAQIEGLEGFDKLKGAFRGLQQAIGPVDAELAKARKQILAFGEAGAKSEQVIKGQIDALKALQSQATIGSTVYRQLGKDVKTLGGAYKEAATGVKEFTDAQLKSQIVGAKPSTFGKQIAALKRDLQDLSVYSQQYTDKLTEIQRRQLPFDTALGRQGVIAAAETYSQGGKGGSALPMMPDTTAALRQRMGELNAELANVTRGGEAWIRVSREMAAVQRELNREFANPAVEAAQRRLEQSRNVTSGFLQFSTGLEDRIAIDKSIARNQRKREAEAAARSGPMQGPPAPSELFQGIAGISNQTASNQLQLMGRSYREVADSIRQTAGASDGSLGSLQRQRAAWEQLRATISPLDKEYAQIEREARRAIAAADRQIGRRQIGGRGGAGQIGQGTGALAASGIFGGPEGFLGSALGGGIGALVGGPAGFATGTFLGGSVGAYAGMGRQAVGGFATYAADISKLEIALKGITKTQDQYQRALAASAAVTRDFNVPQLEATRGMTQLSAAVIGAGGKVADAEVVFRNVTAAIKASGGTSEDVQGALTALGQIFSKGKVSAEELQGQLGERLPGAVTMFAKATGRTLPQLQKDLEQGVVGLADLMKFVVSEQGLGQFEQRAKAVAASSADAGARLTATWNDTKRAIGEALLPLGSEIQDALGGFLRESGPGLVAAAEGLVVFARSAGTALKAFMDFTKPFRDFFAVGIPAYFRAFTAFWSSIGNDVSAFGARVVSVIKGFAGFWIGLFERIKSIGTTTLEALGVDTEWLASATGDFIESIKSFWADLFSFIQQRWRETVSNMINYGIPLFGILKQLGVVDVGKAVTSGLAAAGQQPQTVAGGKTDRQTTAKDELTKWGQLVQQENDKQNDKLLKSRKDALEKIADLERDAIEKMAELRKDTIKNATRLERDLGDERKRIDREIAESRRALDADRAKSALEAERARLSASGQATGAIDAQLAFNESLRRYTEEKIKREEQAQDEALTRARQLEEFKTTVTEAIAKIQEEAAKQAGEIQRAYAVNVAEILEEGGKRAGEAMRQAAVDAASSLGGGNGGAGGSAPITVGKNASSIGLTLQQQLGITRAQAAGILGNLMRESGLNPRINEGGFVGPALGIGGYGLAQWTGGRQQNLRAFAGYEDKRMGDLSTQVAFLIKELRTTEGRALLELRKAVSPEQAAVVFEKYYERAGIKALDERKANARTAYNAIGSVAPAAPQLPASAGALPGPRLPGAFDYRSLLAPVERLMQTLSSSSAIKDAAKDTESWNQHVGDLDKGLRGASAEIDGITGQSAKTLDYQQRLTTLIATGLNPEMAEFRINAERAQESERSFYEGMRNRLQTAIDTKTVTSLQAEGYREIIRGIDDRLAKQPQVLGQLQREFELTQQIARERALMQDNRIGEGFKEGVQQYVESIGTMREATAQLTQNGIKGLEDQLYSLVTTGTANFRQFAADILRQTARMIIQQLVLRTIFRGLGFLGGGGFADGGVFGGGITFNPAAYSMPSLMNANGNAFAKNGIQPFATGGIVNKPTLFQFANGGAMRTGVMGEAGPEAIVPLKRGRDGKLGVAGGGGGSVTVNVSVDASGSKVQGDSNKGEQLGRAVSQAVQDELLRQKRPGGLLAA